MEWGVNAFAGELNFSLTTHMALAFSGDGFGSQATSV